MSEGAGAIWGAAATSAKTMNRTSLIASHDLGVISSENFSSDVDGDGGSR